MLAMIWSSSNTETIEVQYIKGILQARIGLLLRALKSFYRNYNKYMDALKATY